jgi:hypothetical protein
MKIISVALLAGLGMGASALPAAASLGSPTTVRGQDTYSANTLLAQSTAQLGPTGEYSGRSEERGGNFKPKTKIKKVKKVKK